MKLFLLAILAAVTALALAPGANAAITQSDVNYDSGSPPSPSPAVENYLDVYRPDGSATSDSRPVIVYVHGGSWRAGDKDNKITDKVNLFTGLGYVFVSINYRLSPNPIDESYPPDRVRFPDHPDDVGEAIGWVDRNIASFGGDPERIGLIGHSAGAHLIALVSTNPVYLEANGVEPWQIVGTVPLDGDAYDVADRISEVPEATKPNFYNPFGTPAENAAENLWGPASPTTWADPADVDHLLVTQAANPGRAADADALAVKLGQDPATSVFRAPYDHEGINGAVGDPADASGETQAIVSFFERSIAAAKDPRARITSDSGQRVRSKGKGKAAVKFRFKATVEGSRFECRLDSKSFRRCKSPAKYRLKRGRYTFRVRAIAPSGRPGGPEAFRFRVR